MITAPGNLLRSASLSPFQRIGAYRNCRLASFAGFSCRSWFETPPLDEDTVLRAFKFPTRSCDVHFSVDYDYRLILLLVGVGAGLKPVPCATPCSPIEK